jgi:hypothetical protein
MRDITANSFTLIAHFPERRKSRVRGYADAPAMISFADLA